MNDYIMHGMMCSYFTKKLEAYFLIKGIPYQFVEMDAPDMAQCGRQVGVTQMPQVQCPDGSWLTDTTPIIEHFEADTSLPALRPQDHLVAFFSYFLEDCFDEWFWTPGMYYRWAFAMDRNRRSEEFTHTVLANGLPLPRWLLRPIVVKRQQDVHLKANGIVSPAHARQMEDLYLDTLDLLQPILQKRPFLFGDRPCEADIGLFGPMFPHFGCDPTPQEIMHVRAPHVLRWLGRMWSTRPEELRQSAELTEVPTDLAPLLQKLASEYLPYLAANQKAYQCEATTTRYRLGGLDWEVSTAPYRVYCLSQLQQRYQSLSKQNQQKAAGLIGDGASEILAQKIECPPHMQNVNAKEPARIDSDRPLGRHWESSGTFFDQFADNWNARKTSKSLPEVKRPGTSWLPIYFKRFRAR
ncbi:glutathione S-transferase family protein [Congregibacter variabilis]|uniref:Glutathione S-transferase family protein n=1 Tax=Congregibacter variabilis TaxID=3081200 RepID=A0ABZ0I773_9GAMM|nr:glutathione S-transferase family protein [Congregibacter sp. IMCC43200]